MDIGWSNIGVGVAQFGSRSYSEFHLTSYTDKRDLMDAVYRIIYLAGGAGGADIAAAIRKYTDHARFPVGCTESYSTRVVFIIMRF